MANIIPKAEQYLDNDFRVLLIGLHGVGKTESILQLAKERNMKIKYYSCSTLDPYTDLVGVPVPRKGDDGREYLQMIRPRDIDEAEFIFFDELNRADAKTLNAVFEIIQFGTINGEKLPNLRTCWAAINPPDSDAGYNVEELDPALVDRFDTYIEITPRASVAFMAQTLPKPIAQALYSWWSDHNQQRRGMDNYISPRRLLKIGQVFHATGDFRPAVPPWMKQVDKEKLKTLLERAAQDASKQAGSQPAGKLGNGPNPAFRYDEEYLRENRGPVSQYLRDNPQDFDTHTTVIDAIKSKQGRTLARDYAEILDALDGKVREAYIVNLAPGKLDSLKDAIGGLPEYRLDKMAKLKEALGL